MKANSKTLKFIIFLFSFLAVVMVFVFLFVIPSIKEFKHKKAEYYQQIKAQKNLSKREKELKQQFEKLEKKYNTALSAFKKDFSEEEFLALAKKYFTNVKLIPGDKKKTENGLQIYKFTADFSARTPVKFYQFIDAVNKMENVVKINFPIELEAQDRNIVLKFNMSVYKL
jgi:uncharacterized membrane protein YhiD involved in acid resistance